MDSNYGNLMLSNLHIYKPAFTFNIMYFDQHL